MRITYKGTVQGVGFRPAVYRTASSLGLRGTVRNNGSDVVVEVDDGDAFIKAFASNIPPLAHIESMEVSDVPLYRGVSGFTITGSSSSSDGFSIPADTAVCSGCLKDIKSGRRAGYAFTSCTDCGPRFTLLKKLPYDRENTVMRDFPVCAACGRESTDPGDRRFHHQTVCCPECGPKYYVLDKNGRPVGGDPIGTFADALEQGSVGVAKSWGGMHICCSLDRTAYLREWYGRKYKPFAIMVRDADALMKYGNPTRDELDLIQSPQRPIVLVKKKNIAVMESVAPGLNTVGVFLPYTGMQHILFDRLGTDALVMTSANTPGEPMMLDDRDVMELRADIYLLHDQPIINRADDSVVRVIDGHKAFLRKSRGNVPAYTNIRFRGSAVAVGAQENLAGAVARNGRIYPTQHIGNGENVGVCEYLEDAIRFNMSLMSCKPQSVAMDLHPGYANRRFAKRLAEEYGAETIEVQHHWAHSASLMAEHNLDEIVALTLDGTGHGDDGMAWGGEVMYADYDGYKRLAHLEYMPLLGSEKALYDLRRLKFAIDMTNGSPNGDFSDRDAEILRKLAGKSVKTSSMGRFLDAISYSLGLCKERTYDGEPAMRLETLLAEGKRIEGFETRSIGDTVKTAELFTRIGDGSPADVAYSMTAAVIDEMVNHAAAYAESNGIGKIGITGGVSYDEPICIIFREAVMSHGLEPVFHDSVPNGDGGISTGQAAIALKMIE